MTDFEILIVGYPGISGWLPGNFSQVTREFWWLVTREFLPGYPGILDFGGGAGRFSPSQNFGAGRLPGNFGYPGISERLPGNFGYPGISTTANSATTTATTNSLWSK